jgi:hypothetical protein
MTYLFGDGFDLYATFNDALNGFWDGGTGVGAGTCGGTFRGRAIQLSNTTRP